MPLLLNANWIEPPNGGLERYLRALCAAFERDGGPKPTVISVVKQVDAGSSTLAGADPGRPPLVRLWTYARASRSAARDSGLIDAHFAMYALAALVWPSVRRKALVVHFHGPWADESAVVGKAAAKISVMRLVEKVVYRRADKVVVLSKAFKELLVERYGVSPSIVEVMAPGVDSELFHPGDRLVARRTLGLRPHDWVVFAPRRLTPRTGVDVLLEATALIQHGGHRVRLVVAGGGREAGRLVELAERLGITESVSFLGRISDNHLVSAYQAADVVALPSRRLEGFGLVVLEALACGAPVVVTDVGGLAEAVAGLPGTLVVAPERPHDLADALLRQRAAPLADGGPAARRAYAETFSWSEVAARHRQVFRDVAREHAAKGSSSKR